MEQPIEIFKSSKWPGDLGQKSVQKLFFKLNKEHRFEIPCIFIDPLAFSDSRLPSKLAVPPKRFIAFPGQSVDGKVVCTRDVSGLAELFLQIGGGEGEQEINLCEQQLKDWRFIDTSLAAHGGSTISTGASAIASVLSDTIPIWAEISTVAALAATIPRKRVRLLLEFKTHGLMVIETDEVVAILLDHICGGGDDSDESGGEVHVMF